MGAIFSKSGKDDAILFFCLEQEEGPMKSSTEAPGRPLVTKEMSRNASMRRVQVVSKAEDQFLDKFTKRMATTGLKAKQFKGTSNTPSAIILLLDSAGEGTNPEHLIIRSKGAMKKTEVKLKLHEVKEIIPGTTSFGFHRPGNVEERSLTVISGSVGHHFEFVKDEVCQYFIQGFEILIRSQKEANSNPEISYQLAQAQNESYV